LPRPSAGFGSCSRLPNTSREVERPAIPLPRYQSIHNLSRGRISRIGLRAGNSRYNDNCCDSLKQKILPARSSLVTKDPSAQSKEFDRTVEIRVALRIIDNGAVATRQLNFFRFASAQCRSPARRDTFHNYKFSNPASRSATMPAAFRFRILNSTWAPQSSSLPTDKRPSVTPYNIHESFSSMRLLERRCPMSGLIEVVAAVFVPFVAGILVGWGLRSLVSIKERERAWQSRQTET